MTEPERSQNAVIDQPLVPQIRRWLAEADAGQLSELIRSRAISDALRGFLRLNRDERDQVLSLLPAEIAAELIDEAPTEVAADLVERLQSVTAADIIDELESDIRADVIGELDIDDAEAILAEMDSDDAADVRRLVAYGAETAGGLMIAEAFTFREDETVGAVLQRVVDGADDFERYRGQHPYILDESGRPVGVVSLRGLLTAKRNATLAEIMESPLTISVHTSLEELDDFFEMHPFLGAPVVEEDGRLVGVLSRSAVADAIRDHLESDSLKLHGVVGDELRSMPLWLRSRRRLAWLSTNIFLNIIAATVIASYEETLAAVIAIAFFLPMVSDMSGCSGNQAVAVSMRELSLGLVRPIDIFRVWLKEASVGLINGTVLGILIGLVAWLWMDNVVLGFVIGVALAINTVIAVSIGGVVPLIVKRLGQDPAAASGPLLTTITDIAGFFLVLSLATLMMPALLA
ncbi:MAG: magnesium transporter [Gammaproteobacteria bacterium]|nr:magnesium transporter [Gammaproteobacteria bacterium]